MDAKRFIEQLEQNPHSEVRVALQALINEAWADVSFGYSQRIVLFHDTGDRSRSVENCLAVREHVFGDPDEDIDAATRRLAGCFQHATCDGTPLSAMIVYNAGSDRRSDPEWMERWRGNVASYQRALQQAEGYRANV